MMVFTEKCRVRTVLLIVCVLIFNFVKCCDAQDSEADDTGTVKKPQPIDELLLFFPSKFPSGNWNPEGLRFEDIYFSAIDGIELHGWYCPCDKPRAVLLLAHGNAGHIASRAPWLRYLQSKASLSLFIFDYRGYGRSKGTPTVEGVLKDATAARAKLRELANIKDSEMLLMGESLGGAFAIQLAADSLRGKPLLPLCPLRWQD